MNRVFLIGSLPGRPGLVLAVALVVSGRAAPQDVPPPAAETVAPRFALTEFAALRAVGGAFVVDVRNEDAYRGGHVAGAINVPIDRFDRLDTLTAVVAQAAGRTIVAYCSCPNEHASAVAALALIKAGAKRAGALIGGYPAWVASGGAIERGLPARIRATPSPGLQPPACEAASDARNARNAASGSTVRSPCMR